MTHRATLVPLLAALAGCAPASWTVQTWGEDFIEVEIPAADFEDGCAVAYDAFVVGFTTLALRDAKGVDAAATSGPGAYDLTIPGPTVIERLDAPPGHYDTVFVEIGVPNGEVGGNATLPAGASVAVTGTLTCPSGTVTFDWAFDTVTDYACQPEGLTLGAGGAATSEITIHGDHLWYDSLIADDAVLRGELVRAADADADGVVTHAELAAVPIAPTGLDIGPYSDVATLDDYIALLTRTIGHIDGEGHCQVDL